ncbi:MAG: fatty acyl-AMP ligase [Acidobacteriota bacterium]
MIVDADFPQTLPAILRRAAERCRGRGLVFVDEDELKLSWAEVEEQASEVAAGLQGLGGELGDRVALVCQGLRPLVTSFFGAALAGMQPTILPTPISRRRLQGYVQHTSAIVRVAQPRFVLIDEAVHEVGRPLLEAAGLAGRTRIARYETLQQAAGPLRPHQASPDDIAVIQFTSGSTSSPRGVILLHGCISANVLAIVEHLEVAPDDVGGGWLPLYHDMGLIGNLLGAAARSISLVLTTPFNFLRRPRRWLEIMERHRVSITAGPNVSYRHLLERGEAAGKDLSAWRVAIIGAEPVDPDLMDTFRSSMRTVGFPDAGFMPAYGLAEVGLMVTGVKAGTNYEAVRLDRDLLEGEGRAVLSKAEAGTVHVVGVGYPVRETSVRIVDEGGQELPDSQVGEINVRGASVMQGYFNDPEATAETLREGWLYTGDLGYLDNGQLFVTGRKKELIIVEGRNYYPQDIERAIEGIELVRPGSVVAFGTTNGKREGVIVVAAPQVSKNRPSIEREIREVVSVSLNLPVLDVVLMESGRIPRTTSGKLCRGRCRDLYEEGALS